MGKVYLRAFLVAFTAGALLVLVWLQFGGRRVLESGSRHQKLDQMEERGVDDFELHDLDGSVFSLSDFKGKVIILNFWASWCNPCVEEFPSMIKLINHFSGEVVMLAVSNDSVEKEIRDFLKVFREESKSPYLTVLWDHKKRVAKKYEVNRLPETFIIGKDLKLVRKVIGLTNWYNKETLTFFKYLLETE